MAGFVAIIAMLCLICIPVSLIAILIQFIQKKPVKKLFKIPVALFVGFIVFIGIFAVIYDDSDDEEIVAEIEVEEELDVEEETAIEEITSEEAAEADESDNDVDTESEDEVEIEEDTESIEAEETDGEETESEEDESEDVNSDAESTETEESATTETEAETVVVPTTATESSASVSDIAAYSGDPYVVVNGNVPYFDDSELITVSFEIYSDLDSLGRCGVAYANIGIDIMPTEERESISSVYPSGWVQASYDIVDGGYLYNRCHLIGYQLSGENANEKNLITGTRYLNVEGMLPFENMIADYVEETENHVLYRVTPIFEGDNLVASGVLMEAKSVEDDGEGILFCVYCYNVQPGITIDYATGNSALSGETITTDVADSSSSSSSSESSESESSTTASTSTAETTTTTEETQTAETTTTEDTTETMVWIPTNGGTKYHSKSTCSGMVDPQQVTLSQAQAAGYTACKKCY